MIYRIYSTPALLIASASLLFLGVKIVFTHMQAGTGGAFPLQFERLVDFVIFPAMAGYAFLKVARGTVLRVEVAVTHEVIFHYLTTTRKLRISDLRTISAEAGGLTGRQVILRFRKAAVAIALRRDAERLAHRLFEYRPDLRHPLTWPDHMTPAFTELEGWIGAAAFFLYPALLDAVAALATGDQFVRLEPSSERLGIFGATGIAAAIGGLSCALASVARRARRTPRTRIARFLIFFILLSTASLVPAYGLLQAADVRLDFREPVRHTCHLVKRNDVSPRRRRPERTATLRVTAPVPGVLFVRIPSEEYEGLADGARFEAVVGPGALGWPWLKDLQRMN